MRLSSPAWRRSPLASNYSFTANFTSGGPVTPIVGVSHQRGMAVGAEKGDQPLGRRHQAEARCQRLDRKKGQSRRQGRQ